MRAAQQGIILITVLIFLLVLALLSFSALHSSQLQNRMSYNLQDNIQASQAVEAGLIAAEKLLTSGTQPTCFSAEQLPIDKDEKPWLKLKNICQTKLVDVSVKYFVEQLNADNCRTFYQITAWTEDAYPVIVQNIYAITANHSSCQHDLAAGQLLWRELN